MALSKSDAKLAPSSKENTNDVVVLDDLSVSEGQAQVTGQLKEEEAAGSAMEKNGAGSSASLDESDMEHIENEKSVIGHPLCEREVFWLDCHDVVRNMRCDDLIILFHFTQCQKYPTHQQSIMIRSNVRLLSRFLNLAKSIDNRIKNFADMFHIRLSNVTIQSIKDIAGFVPDTKHLQYPAVALTLMRLLKCVGELLQIEYTRRNMPAAATNVGEFIRFLNQANTDLQFVIKNGLKNT